MQGVISSLPLLSPELGDKVMPDSFSRFNECLTRDPVSVHTVIGSLLDNTGLPECADAQAIAAAVDAVVQTTQEDQPLGFDGPGVELVWANMWEDKNFRDVFYKYRLNKRNPGEIRRQLTLTELRVIARMSQQLVKAI